MECSYLLTHGPWMVQSTALVLFQLVKAHWHTCTRTHIETLNAPGHGGGTGKEGGGQEAGAAWSHTTLDHWSRHKTGRGEGPGEGRGITTGRHHGTGHSRNMSNSGRGEGWGRGLADRDTVCYASVVESQFFFVVFFTVKDEHIPWLEEKKKLLVQ